MILVTGGAGFIGSNLHAALVRRGHETVLVDNLGDGAAPATSGRLTLTRRASPDIKVTTFPVPALGPGHQTKVTVRFAVPAAAVGKGYSLEIDLDAKHHVNEYDESNNSTSIAAP